MPRDGRKTAILVIHGIGQQDPYETLDTFARGFLTWLARRFPGRGGRPQVLQDMRPVRINHGDWIEASLQLLFNRSVTDRGLRELHLYEYYWAPHTQRVVTDRAVLSWLVRTGLTPLKYLSQNLHMEWAAAPAGRSWLGRAGRVVGLFVREVFRIAAFYVPVILVCFYGFRVLTQPGQVVGAAKDLYGLLAAETHRPALLAVTVLAVTGACLALFLGKTVVGLLNRRMRSIERPAEVIWLLLSAATLAGCVAGIALVDSFFGPVRIVQEFVRAAGSWPSACALFWNGWPVLRDLLFLVVLYAVRRILVDFVGDIAVYVTADEKAEHFDARSRILKESTEALVRLLKSPERYDRVVVAGHSLGSVIAYDTINRVLDKAWSLPDRPGQPPALRPAELDRLRGLVTFGSPLDKIYYFFRQQVGAEQAFRAQILSFLYGFRRGRSHRDYGRFTLAFGTGRGAARAASTHPQLSKFSWINVWSPFDPVSGRLDFYVLDRGRQKRRIYFPYWFVAHLKYWTDPEFYAFTAEQLL